MLLKLCLLYHCAGNCNEGNLDLQYIMGMSQNTSTTFWYVDPNSDVFVRYAVGIADAVNPPAMNSISWGSIEQVSLITWSYCYII